MSATRTTAIATGVVLFASFLPWLGVSVSMPLFDAASVNITGFSGSISLLGVLCPNVLVFVSALGVLAIVAARERGVGDAPQWLRLMLLAYGAAHLAVALWYGVLEHGVRPGFGLFLAIGAWIALWRAGPGAPRPAV